MLSKYNSLLFVDVETTGLNPTKDKIIDIGAVKIDKLGKIEKYSMLINPGFKLSKEIRKLTGITIKDLEKAPYIEDVIVEIQSILKADLFIAHNAKFDYEFFSQELLRLDIPLEIPYLDTIKIAKVFYPNYLSYSLSSIIDRMKIIVEKRHRGLDDAMVLWQLFTKIHNDFGKEELESMIDKLFVPGKKRKINIPKTQSSLFEVKYFN